jgi:phosphoribosylformimino-5-aminoimidazole carboxamide ribotide isomerase
LRGGQCVRLRQGDFAQETVFGTDPTAIARRWVSQGASYLHLVDLDGAKQGRPVNGTSVRRIVEESGVACQLGGGLRSEKDIAEALNWGVARVIVSTRALLDPSWFEAICRQFAGKVVLGIDAQKGQVATDGWLRISQRSAIDLARQCENWPLAAVIYTDINRDGMLEGPNLDALTELQAATRLPIIASGGVSTLNDIRRLTLLGLVGCIVGRAIYEGRLDLAEAIKVASGL